jgi:NAD(P)-dependent dehydrogenase (short-subunit alcohol dehydrogenase family)
MANGKGELKEKVAIVTGAGRGIGRGIASRLAEAGASVVVADLDLSNAEKNAEEITKSSGKAIAKAVDVTGETSVNAMADFTIKNFGRIDILINNAGIMYRTRFGSISAKEWEEILKVNLTGPFFCIKSVLPTMKKNSFGRIVNISSSAGRSVSTLGGAHYTASKAGLLGLTRAVAKEVAPSGITVNAVCPGLIDTKMVRETTSKDELQAFLDSFPIPRMGLPKEIGDLVVFLCSEKASYITGTSLDVNGGDLMI